MLKLLFLYFHLVIELSQLIMTTTTAQPVVDKSITVPTEDISQNFQFALIQWTSHVLQQVDWNRFNPITSYMVKFSMFKAADTPNVPVTVRLRY